MWLKPLSKAAWTMKMINMRKFSRCKRADDLCGDFGLLLLRETFFGSRWLTPDQFCSSTLSLYLNSSFSS
jgi:hypothetical protein